MIGRLIGLQGEEGSVRFRQRSVGDGQTLGVDEVTLSESITREKILKIGDGLRRATVAPVELVDPSDVVDAMDEEDEDLFRCAGMDLDDDFFDELCG